MYVKKANGSIEEYKRELNSPDLVLDTPESDSLLQNALVSCLRMFASLQHRTRSSDYKTDLNDAKILNLLTDVTLKIDAHKQKSAAHDAFAALPEEELFAKLKQLYAAKVDGK